MASKRDNSNSPPSINELKDNCCWKRCREVSDIILLGFGVCQVHYEKYCSLHSSASVSTIKKYVSAETMRLLREYYIEE